MNTSIKHEDYLEHLDKFSQKRRRIDSEDSIDENFGQNNWTKWLNGFAFDYDDYSISEELIEFQITKSPQVDGKTVLIRQEN